MDLPEGCNQDVSQAAGITKLDQQMSTLKLTHEVVGRIHLLIALEQRSPFSHWLSAKSYSQFSVLTDYSELLTTLNFPSSKVQSKASFAHISLML